MNQGGSKTTCFITCLVIAGLIGLIAFLLLMIVGDWRALSALMIGAVIAAIGAAVFPLMFCGNSTEPQSAGSAGKGAGSALSPSAAKTTATAASSSAAASTASAASASTAPVGLMSTDATTSAPAAAPVAKKPAAKKPASKKPAAKNATAKKPAAKAAPAKKAAASAGKAAPVAKDGKPPLLKKARASGADDLKQIKGVGPGLEKTLNELGFYHFDQVAAWRKKEIEWVDDRLKFKGRIVRDEWTKQAKLLAKGGTTEFSKKVKKGDVY